MRGKYETHVKPKLDLIAQWARDGAIERDIAKKLGVSESTFSGYKKEHEELMQTLTAVSYTHLDVYKRQEQDVKAALDTLKAMEQKDETNTKISGS